MSRIEGYTYGQREIFAKGVALESIVGKNTSKIGVTNEEDAEKIPYFSLVPVKTQGISGESLVFIGQREACFPTYQSEPLKRPVDEGTGLTSSAYVFTLILLLCFTLNIL